MTRAYIVDGSNFLYRAYHGMPVLHDREGQPVQCVFAFCKMMIRLLTDKPDYMTIVRDYPAQTIRGARDDAYKAQRPSMPDDMKRQFAIAKAMVDKLGIPVLQYEGYEADDVIYSLSDIYMQYNLTATDPIYTYIYTCDKDMKQLINQYTYIVDTMKNIEINYDKFVTEYDFDPIYIVDYLSLIGDSSDNLKGVSGIGPKTAQALIAQYHTIENIYLHIDEISPNISSKLKADQDIVVQTKSMIQLLKIPNRDLDISTLRYIPDRNVMQDELVVKMGFRSLASTIGSLRAVYTVGSQTSLF